MDKENIDSPSTRSSTVAADDSMTISPDTIYEQDAAPEPALILMGPRITCGSKLVFDARYHMKVWVEFDEVAPSSRHLVLSFLAHVTAAQWKNALRKDIPIVLRSIHELRGGRT